MPLNLNDIRQLAADVARDEDPRLEVLAAMNGEGATDYAEIIIAIDGRPSEPDRIVIGLSRNAAISDIRHRLRERLRERKHPSPDPREAPMAPDKIDDLADDLDDLITTADELKEYPPAAVHSDSVEALRRALEEARDAADELEDQKADFDD